MKGWRVVQHIYEGGETEPTLTHVFYGTTKEEAWGVHDAHLKTDSFMRGCETEKRFRNFGCHVENYVERALPNGTWVRDGYVSAGVAAGDLIRPPRRR